MEQRAARILVVDDEDAIRLTLDLILRRRGYTVVTAPNGEADEAQPQPPPGGPASPPPRLVPITRRRK